MTSPGRIGPYRIERLLGTGSFATVWLAHDPVLDSRVAIKVLAENWHHDLRVRERFLDEARLLRRLDDERLVRVHGVGELADGRPYSVLTWADGGSLRDRLAAGPVPAPAALELLAEIAAGVAVLHRHGVVHRDLSPGNVLFRSGPDGERVLIADLGLAKALAAASGLTARAGTPGYMAPEQDDPFAIVDTRADVYALGRLGLRLFAPAADVGAAPGAAPGAVAVAQAAGGGAPPEVAAVLRRATAPRAADRYLDATAFRAALRRPAPAASAPAASAPVPAAPVPAAPVPAAPVPAAPVPAAPVPAAPVPAAPVPAAPVPAAPAPAALASAASVPAAPASAVPAPAAGTVRHPARWARTEGRPVARRRLGALALGVLTLLAALSTAGDDTAGRRDAGSWTSGPVTVALPLGWRATGTGWAGRYGPDGRLEPALVMSPDPHRWAADPTVPGAFVGLSASIAARTSPAGFVAERPHAACVAAPVRRTRQAGVDWVVARFTCDRGRPEVVEAAGLAPGRAGLVYVQITPPPGSRADFVDTLLAGVRVG
ncbi:serine/threonine-protein kinase [Micromonospora sp. NPDC049060]|uniref:serine/threonine-protein kinase n=1 Tax=Micromonospora sp. NPDC049060 TaxID=3154828 RepID=UPI0033E9BAAD